MDEDEMPKSQADALRAGLMDIGPTLEPIYEFAEGQRTILRQRGWSSVAADSIAATLTRALIVRQFTTKGTA